MGVFVFLRHGQTDNNKDCIFCGHLDMPLNEEGYREAAKTGRNLRPIHFDAVYSSPLIRTKNTARIIMEESAHPTDIFYIEGLKEMYAGEWEGKKASEVESTYPAEWSHYLNNFLTFTFPKGESVAVFNERTANYMQGLKKRHPHGNILIVSHKGFILSAISYLLHGCSKEMRKYDIGTGKTATVECFGSQSVLKSLNC